MAVFDLIKNSVHLKTGENEFALVMEMKQKLTDDELIPVKTKKSEIFF